MCTPPGEMSVAELLEKYKGAYTSDFEEPSVSASPATSEEEESTEEEEEEESEGEDSEEATHSSSGTGGCLGRFSFRLSPSPGPPLALTLQNHNCHELSLLLDCVIMLVKSLSRHGLELDVTLGFSQ